MIDTLNAVLIARPILEAAKSNANHPLYHHVIGCAERILKWPTVSTMIERSFSEVTAHFSKQGNRMHAETLCNIHHNNQSSNKFMDALRAAASANKIEIDN